MRLTTRLLWLATLVIGAREAYLNRAQPPATQGGAVGEASFKETVIETVNTTPEEAARAQMSEPDI